VGEKMNQEYKDEGNTRQRKRKKKTKKKRGGRKGCLWGCLIFLLILLVIGLLGGLWVYNNVQNTAEEAYEPIENQQVHESRDEPVDVSQGDPASVLLMGVDTGAEGRTDQGRSDTMMVMAANPNTESSTLVSIPRDTYTEIAGRGTMDKINHAYAFGGTSMAVNTVQNMFNIPIDYYVSVNMEGLEQIVDALGGITITPMSSFEQGGYSFVEGQPTQMDGNMVLEYSRMRYEDPSGDYGRQERQRQVVQAIVNSIASVDSIMNYQGILEVIGNNMQTNMTFGEMVDVFGEYRTSGSNMEQVQMSGEGTRIDGTYYDLIPEAELNRVQGTLQETLELN